MPLFEKAKKQAKLSRFGYVFARVMILQESEGYPRFGALLYSPAGRILRISIFTRNANTCYKSDEIHGWHDGLATYFTLPNARLGIFGIHRGGRFPSFSTLLGLCGLRIIPIPPNR